MKIKIVEPGWEGYNGHLGEVEFVDAVSVTDVNEINRNRLGANLRIAEVESDGSEGSQVSTNAEYELARNIGMAIEVPLERGVTTVNIAAAPAISVPVPTPLEPTTVVPTHIYTKPELEEIADTKGIKGLRDISTPLGVKESSIPALIEKIMSAQKANKPQE